MSAADDRWAFPAHAPSGRPDPRDGIEVGLRKAVALVALESTGPSGTRWYDEAGPILGVEIADLPPGLRDVLRGLALEALLILDRLHRYEPAAPVWALRLHTPSEFARPEDYPPEWRQ